jgi:uncharacterized protein
MAQFDPVSALVGGLLIGIASALLMVLNGRIAGISGILGGAIATVAGDETSRDKAWRDRAWRDRAWRDRAWRDRAWRLAFIAGLIAAPIVGGSLGRPLPAPQMPASWVAIVAAGLLVGFGARLGGGCTSGHGVCGIARLSARSLVATAIFVATAMVVVAIVRHCLAA